METWRSIPSYEGSYEVSNCGNVRSLDRFLADGRRRKGQVLKPFISGRPPGKDGRKEGRYLYVELGVTGGKRKAFPVHKLVALAFLGGPEDGQEVCHGDRGRWDNSVENLRWDTRSANSHDALKEGTHVVIVRNKKVGN